jgi:hypothetical protein
MVVVVVAALAALGLIAFRELVRFGAWKATRQWIIVTIAGLAASYLAAAGVAFAYLAVHGRTTGYQLAVTEVLPGFDAAGKIEPGDVLVAVDRQPVELGGTSSLPSLINRGAGAPVTVTVERAGASRDVVVQPRRDTGGTESWVIGVRKAVVPILDTGASDALRIAASFPITEIRAMVAGFWPAVEGPSDPGGPKAIVEEVDLHLSFGIRVWQLLLRFAAIAMLVMVVVDAIRIVLLVRKSSKPAPR